MAESAAERRERTADADYLATLLHDEPWPEIRAKVAAWLALRSEQGRFEFRVVVDTKRGSHLHILADARDLPHALSIANSAKRNGIEAHVECRQRDWQRLSE